MGVCECQASSGAAKGGVELDRLCEWGGCLGGWSGEGEVGTAKRRGLGWMMTD